MPGFDPVRYSGLWYEQRRYETAPQLNGDCVTANYDLNADGSISVRNALFNLATQTASADTGKAVLAFPDQFPLMARLNVTFGGGRKLKLRSNSKNLKN